MRVVGCFLQYNNRFVLVYRRPLKIDGNTWGLPSGKVEADESDIEALRRELYEETGYYAQDSEVELLNEHDFISPRGDTFTYTTYQVKIDKPHEMKLEESSHSEFKWVTIEEADSMNDLIYGLHDVFRFVGFIK